MIDTHAHLDPADAPAVLERARAAGVDRIVVIATTVAQATATLGIAEEHDGVYACLGVHPHEAADPGDLARLRLLLGRNELHRPAAEILSVFARKAATPASPANSALT